MYIDIYPRHVRPHILMYRGRLGTYVHFEKEVVNVLVLQISILHRAPTNSYFLILCYFNIHEYIDNLSQIEISMKRILTSRALDVIGQTFKLYSFYVNIIVIRCI